jgi:hypothetical protein
MTHLVFSQTLLEEGPEHLAAYLELANGSTRSSRPNPPWS